MSNYKKDILDLNYCLYSSLTGSVIFRDDCAIALNPQNPVHQQSNLCFRIRLLDEKNLGSLLKETIATFQEISCQPRYHIDELSTPSLERICTEFMRLGYKNIDIDTDLIMSWESQEARLINSEGSCRKATIDDLEDITRVFAASFGYEDSDWLQYKLRCQLLMPNIFQLFVVVVDLNIITSVVILHTPPGLPHLGHVSSVATHPHYQRRGMASVCIQHALQNTCKVGQKFYLETYDDLYHAHRMYEKVGFKHEGLLKSSMITFDDNK